MEKTKMQVLLDYLRTHPTGTNQEIADGLGEGYDREFVKGNISIMKTRKWIKVTGQGANRTIEVTYEDPANMQEYKKGIYTQMLPTLLYSFEQTTNIQDQVLAAKTIFKILDNL